MRYHKKPKTQYGALVRKMRMEAGLTQKDLAQKADLPGSVVSMVETGRTKRPEPVTLRKLEAALGVKYKRSRGPYIRRAVGYAPKSLGKGKVVEIGGRKLSTVLVTIETEGVFPMRRDTARVFNASNEDILNLLNRTFGQYAAPATVDELRKQEAGAH